MKNTTLSLLIYTAFMGASLFAACGSDAAKEQPTETADTLAASENSTVPVKELKIDQPGFKHTYLVADQADERHIYKEKVSLANTFLVVSKREYRLYVYERVGKDTLLAASFPVCYAIYPEPKERGGDDRTPECGLQHPFSISQMVDAKTWCFDFQDGRGMIAAFGNWFMRLDLSKSFPSNPSLAANKSIGIHGCTGNEMSVPGRDSHGCVRLLDADIAYLHDHYTQVGTQVVIKGMKENKWPFEVKAQQRLGKQYKAPKPGNPVLKKNTSQTAPAKTSLAQ